MFGPTLPPLLQGPEVLLAAALSAAASDRRRHSAAPQGQEPCEQHPQPTGHPKAAVGGRVS